jgi:hypothetical protein
MAVVLRRAVAFRDPIGDGHYVFLLAEEGHQELLAKSPDWRHQHSGTVIALAITSQPQRAGLPLTIPT